MVPIVSSTICVQVPSELPPDAFNTAKVFLIATTVMHGNSDTIVPTKHHASRDYLFNNVKSVPFRHAVAAHGNSFQSSKPEGFGTPNQIVTLHLQFCQDLHSWIEIDKHSPMREDMPMDNKNCANCNHSEADHMGGKCTVDGCTCMGYVAPAE
jgi:hypothetical protein